MYKLFFLCEPDLEIARAIAESCLQHLKILPAGSSMEERYGLNRGGGTYLCYDRADVRTAVIINAGETYYEAYSECQFYLDFCAMQGTDTQWLCDTVLEARAFLQNQNINAVIGDEHTNAT